MSNNKEVELKHWEEFYNSYNMWWSFCIVPLNYYSMLLAVAYGDAEVKHINDDKEWPADFFFRWVRPLDQRACDYFEKKPESSCVSCTCEKEELLAPKERVNDVEEVEQES